jgi:hypothetical protein
MKHHLFSNKEDSWIILLCGPQNISFSRVGIKLGATPSDVDPQPKVRASVKNDFKDFLKRWLFLLLLFVLYVRNRQGLNVTFVLLSGYLALLIIINLNTLMLFIFVFLCLVSSTYIDISLSVTPMYKLIFFLHFHLSGAHLFSCSIFRFSLFQSQVY